MTMLAAHNSAKIVKTGTREEKNTITEKIYIIKQYKFTHTLVCFNNFSISYWQKSHIEIGDKADV